ncbi:MAG TPA: YqhA family protein [Acidimicrobiales bacterium]|nr:YqhA family protein [Acidimicrobiales bacterium]
MSTTPADRPREPPATSAPERQRQRFEHLFEFGLVVSRGLVLIPVLVLLIAAAGAFIYGTAVFVDAVVTTVRHPFPVGHKVASLMLVIDFFLVGATMLIAAIGFYELFISKVDPARAGLGLPTWLEMRDLDDLKARVISMIILVAAVSFVDVLVDFRGGNDVFFLGAGVALVVGSLTAFLRFASKDRSANGPQ